MKKPILFLGIIGGLLYNNWLLGYWLNDRITRLGLASDLQVYNQPYGWLFILGDVLSGLMIVIVAYLIYQKKQPSDYWLEYLAIGYFCFGAFTAIAAVLPIHCGSNLTQCGLGTKLSFGLHDAIGAIASLGQFISLLAVWKIGVKLKMPAKYNWLTFSFMCIWGLAGIVFLAFTFKNVETVLMQHIFLLLTFAAIIVAPLGVVLSGKS